MAPGICGNGFKCAIYEHVSRLKFMNTFFQGWIAGWLEIFSLTLWLNSFYHVFSECIDISIWWAIYNTHYDIFLCIKIDSNSSSNIGMSLFSGCDWLLTQLVGTVYSLFQVNIICTKLSGHIRSDAKVTRVIILKSKHKNVYRLVVLSKYWFRTNWILVQWFKLNQGAVRVL